MKAWKKLKRTGWRNLVRERRLKLEEAAHRRAHKADSDECYKRRQKMLMRLYGPPWARSQESGRLCRADSESDAAPAMGD